MEDPKYDTAHTHEAGVQPPDGAVGASDAGLPGQAQHAAGQEVANPAHGGPHGAEQPTSADVDVDVEVEGGGGQEPTGESGGDDGGGDGLEGTGADGGGDGTEAPGTGEAGSTEAATESTTPGGGTGSE